MRSSFQIILQHIIDFVTSSSDESLFNAKVVHMHVNHMVCSHFHQISLHCVAKQDV